MPARLCAKCGLYIAEEGGSGKVLLLEKGAYKDMDACLMHVSWNFFDLMTSALTLVSQVPPCARPSLFYEFE